jgi:hypothetical protein
LKIYIAGKITGELPYHYRHKFGYAATKLRAEGYKVINPVELNGELSQFGFDYEDMMRICFAAIDTCDAVYMLSDWSESPGARREHEYAINSGKEIIYQNVKERA